jgi:flagellar motor switch protein FliN/FliY
MPGIAEVREAAATEAPPEPASDPSGAISGLELRLAAELGRAIVRVDDLLALRPGSVVRLARPADEPLDLTVAGRRIGRGQLLVIDDVLALRMVDVVGVDAEGGAR